MNIRQETTAAFRELCDIAEFAPHQLIVVGGSSSEIAGGVIGKNSSMEIGTEVVQALLEVAKERNLALAIQCCEHLNRSLVVEQETAERYGYDRVSVVPWLHAGGSLATNAMALFNHPVVVERVAAHGGLDIGQTLIGMHLRRVAIPVRLEHHRIGQATVVAARTRYPLIGGERARYQ